MAGWLLSATGQPNLQAALCRGGHLEHSQQQALSVARSRPLANPIQPDGRKEEYSIRPIATPTRPLRMLDVYVLRAAAPIKALNPKQSIAHVPRRQSRAGAFPHEWRQAALMNDHAHAMRWDARRHERMHQCEAGNDRFVAACDDNVNPPLAGYFRCRGNLLDNGFQRNTIVLRLRRRTPPSHRRFWRVDWVSNKFAMPVQILKVHPPHRPGGEEIEVVAEGAVERLQRPTPRELMRM